MLFALKEPEESLRTIVFAVLFSVAVVLSFDSVPDVKFEAFRFEMFAPFPLKDSAVIAPAENPPEEFLSTSVPEVFDEDPVVLPAGAAV